MITNVFEDVVSLITSYQQQEFQIESLGARGTWCGYQDGSWSKVGTITYDRLTYSDSNLNVTGTPLDIDTGIFTVPVSGAWRVSFSMWSRVDTSDTNWAYLYVNGEDLEETAHLTEGGSSIDYVTNTGGREVILEVSAGDTITLGAYRIGNGFYYITFCAEY